MRLVDFSVVITDVCVLVRVGRSRCGLLAVGLITASDHVGPHRGHRTASEFDSIGPNLTTSDILSTTSDLPSFKVLLISIKQG